MLTMSLRAFPHTIEVVRRAAAAAGAAPTVYDTWNALAYGADAVVATVRGRIRPTTIREQAMLSEAGPTAAEARGYLPAGTDVLAGDRLRKSTGETYEVRGVIPDPAGTTAYVFVELSRVTA